MKQLTPAEKMRGNRALGIGCLGIIVIAVLVGLAKSCEPRSAADIRREKIEALMSDADGGFDAVNAAIRGRLAIPASYKQVQTRYETDRDTFRVYVEYTATNALGGTVRGRAEATMTTAGNLLSLEMP